MREKNTAVGSPKAIKGQQIVIAIVSVLGLLFVVILGLWVSDGETGRAAIEKQRNLKAPVTQDYTSDIPAQEDIWLAKSEADIAELRKGNAQLAAMFEIVSQQLENMEIELAKSNRLNDAGGTSLAFPAAINEAQPFYEQGTPSNFQQTAVMPPSIVRPNVVDRMVTNSVAKQQAIQTPTQQTTQMPVTVANSRIPPTVVDNRLTVIDLSPPTTPVSEQGKTVNNYLPSGTFVTATLLSGVDAPTGGQADSNPLPILLRLVDNGQMPNFFRSYVENCHITGAAVGQMSSERAFIRLEMMSCVLKNGRIIERQVKGYVTGEDGKAGLRGKVVTKQGALLARSAAAGFLQGFGSSLSNVGMVSTVAGTVTQSPSTVLQSGIAQGSGDAFAGLADYYLERANETHAIIEVSAGRIGEIIFTQGVDFGTSIGGLE